MAKIDRFLEKCYNLFRYRGERVSDMLKTGNLKNERVIGYNIYRIMEQQNVTVEQLASLVQTSEIHIKEITTGSIDVQDDELVLSRICCKLYLMKNYKNITFILWGPLLVRAI